MSVSHPPQGTALPSDRGLESHPLCASAIQALADIPAWTSMPFSDADRCDMSEASRFVHPLGWEVTCTPIAAYTRSKSGPHTLAIPKSLQHTYSRYITGSMAPIFLDGDVDSFTMPAKVCYVRLAYIGRPYTNTRYVWPLCTLTMCSMPIGLSTVGFHAFLSRMHLSQQRMYHATRLLTQCVLLTAPDLRAGVYIPLSSGFLKHTESLSEYHPPNLPVRLARIVQACTWFGEGFILERKEDRGKDLDPPPWAEGALRPVPLTPLNIRLSIPASAHARAHILRPTLRVTPISVAPQESVAPQDTCVS